MTPAHDLDALLPDQDMLRARREALVGELQGAPQRARRRRRVFGRRLAVTVVALLAAGTAGAAATGLFSADDVAVKAGIGCYSEPKLDAGAIAIIGALPNPVAACTRLWRNGQVMVSTHSAPPLVACTGKGQPVHVFPSSDPALCGRLDLVPLPADYAKAGSQALKDSWTLRHLGRVPQASVPCPSPAALLAQARDRLVGVHVRIAGDRPCAGPYDVQRGDVIVTTLSREAAGERFASRRVAAARAAAAANAADGVKRP